MVSKRVLITGGMGFIGKFLVRKLLKETDYQITIVDNLSSSKADKQLLENKRIKFINANFMTWEPEKKEKYSQIYHLASPVGPLGVLKYKGLIGEMIILQIYKVARLAMSMDAKLIEISTSEVYGKHPDNEKLGQKEDIDKIVPAQITVRLEYGVSKLLCEIILKNLSRDNQLRYICIRPFNIVGPDQNDELGFIIPRFLKQSLSGEPITVYGDGSQKRTFTHVQDFVDAIFLLMESGISGDVFNVGNSANVITILELAKMIKKATNSKSDIIFVDPANMYKDFAEAWNKIPNAEKLKSAVGWEPKYNLPEIIEEIKKMKQDYLIK